MMLGDLLNAGSGFEDTPLTAADFQFSNALETVDPTTGLPPVAAPVVIAAPAVAQSSGAGWLVIAAAFGAWYFWPQIKSWGSQHAAL